MKDKEAIKMREAQKELRQKYCKSKKQKLNAEEKQSVKNLYKQLRLWKGD